MITRVLTHTGILRREKNQHAVAKELQIAEALSPGRSISGSTGLLVFLHQERLHGASAVARMISVGGGRTEFIRTAVCLTAYGINFVLADGDRYVLAFVL